MQPRMRAVWRQGPVRGIFKCLRAPWAWSLCPRHPEDTVAFPIEIQWKLCWVMSIRSALAHPGASLCSKPTSVQLHAVNNSLFPPVFIHKGRVSPWRLKSDWGMEILTGTSSMSLTSHKQEQCKTPTLIHIFNWGRLSYLIVLWHFDYPCFPLYSLTYLDVSFQSLSPSFSLYILKCWCFLKFLSFLFSFYFTQLLETELIHSHDINYD